MATRKRPRRQSSLEDALDQALATRVPEKDTGPDPDDILAGMTDDIAGPPDAARNLRHFSVSLEADERQRVEKVTHLIFEATGERIDTATALRVALKACKLQADDLAAAHASLSRRPEEPGA